MRRGKASRRWIVARAARPRLSGARRGLLALAGFYTAAYRGSAPWAGAFAKVFAPLANSPLGATPGAAQESPPPGWTGTDRLNVLLLGIDSRDEAATTQNTDTMIVLSLDPVNKTAAMLSIPRDVYIDRRASSSTRSTRRTPWVVRPFAKGRRGPSRIVNAYALVDFDAFTKIVDSVAEW